MNVIFIATLLIGQCPGGHCPYTPQYEQYSAPATISAPVQNSPVQSGECYSSCGECYSSCREYYLSSSSCYPSPGIGRLTLNVPEESIVTINDHSTKSVGTKREYKSNLYPGYNYVFDIVVKYNGQVSREQVPLVVGQRKQIVFNFPSIPVMQKLEPRPQPQPIPVAQPKKSEEPKLPEPKPPVPAVQPKAILPPPEKPILPQVPETKVLKLHRLDDKQPIPDLELDIKPLNYEKQ
jgi:hypothetical protein